MSEVMNLSLVCLCSSEQQARRCLHDDLVPLCEWCWAGLPHKQPQQAAPELFPAYPAVALRELGGLGLRAWTTIWDHSLVELAVV